MIPTPICATSSCPRARRAARGMTEAELAALVTRDAMIGVTTVKPPASGGKGARA